MLKTKIVIEVEAKNLYTEKEMQNLSEQICNFVAGPDGNGLVIGNKFSGEDKTFETLNIKVSRPEELVWHASIFSPK